MFTHWNLFVLNKYNRDVRSDAGRYEDSGAVCAAVVSVAAGFSEGVSLTAGVSVASSMSAGVCLAAKETGRMWSDGAREDGSVTPGMLGSVEGRTVCMGRGEMPGRFRGGRGGKPAVMGGNPLIPANDNGRLRFGRLGRFGRGGRPDGKDIKPGMVMEGLTMGRGPSPGVT